MRQHPKSPKPKAKLPVAPKSPKNQSSKVRDLEKRLAEARQREADALKRESEALERQMATGEILRVISQSPIEVEPVFKAILASGVRLCGASFGGVFRFDGELIHLVTSYEWPPERLEAIHRRFPMPPGDGSLAARAIRDRRVAQTADYIADSRAGALPEWVPAGKQQPRGTIAIPMLREGRPIGAIVLARAESGLFSDQHVALLQTFADQAVIAIENVRLFTELQEKNQAFTQAQGQVSEALDQQTATSEILKVIASSPTDTQPVFDAIAQSAVNLCDALFSTVFRYDGGLIHHAADNYPTAEMRTTLTSGYPAPPDEDNATAMAIRERRIVHVEDVLHDTTPAGSREVALALGYRTLLCVPMLREGLPIGTINVARREPRPFTDTQIGLIQTFADQAVIAIENVRLFKELGTRNHDLTEALDQQTATAEILRGISSSPTDVQPVFEAIVHSAVRLLRAYSGALTRVDDEQIALAAFTHTDDAGNAALRAGFPQSLQSDLPHAQTIRNRAPLNITDAQTDPRLPEAEHVRARVRGFRSRVLVPLLCHDEGIGAISVARREHGGFDAGEIALLETFADQAVIAIENVRLFNETKEALEQQTATGDILKVIASSPTDIQPVFAVVAESAARLCDAYDAVIYQLDADALRLVGHAGPIPIGPVGQFKIPLVRGTHNGRVVLERRTMQVADLQMEDVEYPEGSVIACRWGHRTVLGAPLLRAGEAIGAITVRRTEVRPFTNRQVKLLQTFADQAVIAIENVRLFTELQEKNRALTEAHAQVTEALDQQTATSEILQTIAQAQTDVQPVFDTIVRSAAQLCRAHTTAVFLTDGAMVHHPASYGDVPEALAVIKTQFPRPLDRETAAGTAILTRSVIHVPDVEEPSAKEFARQTGRAIGFRSLLSVPMLRQGEAVGAINVTRREPGPFPEAAVALLQTFADQAVIAIENVRLFKELAAANRELAAASQHKSEFLANMSHELRTPLNAIIGFSEVLSEKMFGELNEKQEEYSKDIHASGQHLLSLINDILDLSKIEAGRMELELTDFHLPQAIDNALTLVRERAGRRGIALAHTMDERLGEIRGDERKIKQVLLNLLSNALKFTPEGGRVEVRAGMVDGMAEISVTDTGVGIAPEDQEKVFEEFRQVGTAEKKAEGTGLGLTLCRKFIELHGGRIWVKSQVGEGSTFTFTIPVRRNA